MAKRDFEYLKLCIHIFVQYVFPYRNDMFTTILQQILSNKLLLVVIVGLEK